jgi:hypothetical protein
VQSCPPIPYSGNTASSASGERGKARDFTQSRREGRHDIFFDSRVPVQTLLDRCGNGKLEKGARLGFLEKPILFPASRTAVIHVIQ